MPEGDTIFRAARALHEALAGKVVTRFETVLPALARVDDQTPIRGRKIERVAAAGKNLIISFSGDLHLRTHMRMNGSWHLYPTGQRWQKRRSDMRVVVATADYEAVAFNVPVAELHTSRSLERTDDLRLLGPDLLAPDFDAAEGLRRMRARGGEAIADVLLNQRVIAGLGNVYKSEVLFLRGIHPLTPVSALEDDELATIIETSRKLMRANVRPESSRRRTTGSAAGLWVYGRSGQPCRRCGTRIEFRKQGTDARVTYWCPRCQER